jgi:hypothetical protein
MTRDSALIDEVLSVVRERGRAATAEVRTLTVRFGGGATARLDPASARDRAWAEVLESLKEMHQPAYVEIDPETGYLRSLLLPRPFTVKAMRETAGGDLEIDLEISHARHYLRREHSRFEVLRKTLETARRTKGLVLVTESLDGSAIVDVRPVRAARAGRRR